MSERDFDVWPDHLTTSEHAGRRCGEADSAADTAGELLALSLPLGGDAVG